MKKLAILVLVISFIALLYGCCSHSKSDFFVNPSGDVVVTSREVVIDELGRLPTVTFPSGASISGPEENTLTPGIKVTLIEQKTTSKNFAYFNYGEINSINFYKISALLEPSSLAESKTYVTTVEKPLKVTLPTNNETGLCYLGIKESETDPWRFARVVGENENLSNRASVASASNIVSKLYTFNIYRFGSSFGLFSYNSNNGKLFPETVVDSLTASSAASILAKDGKYLENLPIKGLVKGRNIDSINQLDLRARITYRSNSEIETPIKVNDRTVTLETTADKTVPGYKYRHSFIIDNISDFLLMNSEGQFDFTFNLNGIETDFFPSGFLIEFFNKISGEKILPYCYTEFYKVEKKEAVDLVFVSDEGNIIDEVGPLYKCSPTFTITPGKELNDTAKAKISEAVSVSNAESNVVSKVWEGNSLKLSFTQELEVETDYTVSMSEITGLEGLAIKSFEDFSFTTGYEFCDYQVIHRLENLDNSFNIAEAQNLSAKRNSEVTPAVKTFAGFNSPESQTITVVASETNEIVYDYTRKSFNLSLIKGTGIAGVSGGGSYRFGEDVVASYSLLDGYRFVSWTGDMNVATFTMPDHDVSMTAKATDLAYTIVYELNGGVTESENPDGYNTTTETITLNNPSKTGYNFVGWTGSNGDVPQITVKIETGSIGDKTFIASYTPKIYNIVYTMNGGVSNPANPENYDISSPTITLNNPTKEGYAFAGWTGSNGDIPQMTVAIASGSTGDRAYTANYSAVSYLITYNLDGGINAPENPSGFNKASETITLGYPTKMGYSFSGWSGTGLEGSNNLIVTIPQGSNENKEYTAHWATDSFMLALNLGSGIAAVSGDGLHEYGSTVTASCTMQNGYQFDCWSGDYNTETFVMPANVVSMTANAKVKPYTITYELNGGTENTNPTKYDVTSATINLNYPNKDYYIFTGWTGSNGNVPQKNAAIVTGSYGDKSFTANFVPASFTISYILDDGLLEEGVSNPVSYDITSAAIILNNPSKANMDFLGWTGSNGDEPQRTVTILQGSHGNLSYTANYTPIYTISYNLYDGSLADGVSNPATYSFVSDDIILNNPTKANSDFWGWTTSVDDTPKTTLIIPHGSTGNRTYYALFNPRYNLTYKNVDGCSFAAPNPTTYNKTSPNITLNNPTKAGYDFIGWTSSDTPNPQLTLVILESSEGSRTFTANFAERYPINYDLDGGEVAIGNPTEYSSATADIVLNAPTKGNYDFIGWTGSNGNVPQPNVTIPKGSTEPRTYTANYTPAAFRITYNLDGGSVAGHNPTGYNIASDTIDLINPTKRGYNFTGWSGTDLVGNNNMSVSIPNGSTGHREYTAHYSIINYTITLNYTDGTLKAGITNPVTYNVTTPDIVINNPTKAGNADTGFNLFGGWIGTDVPTFASYTLTIPQGSIGNKEYTAQWIKLDLVHCNAGTFTMGTPAEELGRGNYEGPQQQVTLSKDFYIGKYVVTQAQYFAVMGINHSSFRSHKPNVTPTIYANYPANSISYYKATMEDGFIAKLNEMLADQLSEGYKFDLPTEAQWEYACRAGTTTALNSGKNITASEGACVNVAEVAWYGENSDNHIQAVGQKLPNAWGIYDMHGNVWEWCKDTLRLYSSTPITDPYTPLPVNKSAIWRGGGYLSPPHLCRSGKRQWCGPYDAGAYTGFRIALVKDSH